MKNSFIKKSLVIILAITFIFCVVGCKKKKPNPNPGENPIENNRPTFDNENDPLVFSSAEVDKVFNPFFSTTAADSNVVGLTQVGMIGNNSKGEPAYGKDEPVVVLDLETRVEGVENVNQTTTYYFVLKNNVKFSNGSSLTIKDVLFNLYVYLDKAYTGSSTIYSTDIVGLKQYQTQKADENEQDKFDEQFKTIADARIDALISCANEIFKDHKDDIVSEEDFLVYLEELATIPGNENVITDYTKATELFEEELKTDFNNNRDTYEDITFEDKNGKVYKNLFTTDVEAFLYAEGYIKWDKKQAKLTSSLVNDKDIAELKKYTEAQAIEAVYEDKVPFAITEIVEYWATAANLFSYIQNNAMEEYFKNQGTVEFPNIEGIKFANKDSQVTVNGVTYDIPRYDENGGVLDGYNEVLSIQIHDIDPKAIWNFSFAVAPMYYYSDAEHIAKFDYVANFGVERASQSFLETVVKNKDRIGVPVGAGPYAASKSSGGITNVSSGDFYNKGVIYFERNPYYFFSGKDASGNTVKYPLINKLRYQVTPSNSMLNALYTGEIDFADPNSKPTTLTELDGKKSDGIGYKEITTSGYGYIGINAGKVPDINVRRAIMFAINPKECVDYYQTSAEQIFRSMSKVSWAYPKNATAYYPYIGGPVPENLNVVNKDYANYVTSLGKKAGDKLTQNEQNAFIRKLVEDAGYTLNGDNVYQKGSHVLEYRFTIAGSETDHPAWQALNHAREILNNNGFNIDVKTDAQALSKLATGDLTVWAAAWGSTIDPDMYQVYHKESKATSTLNWGYKQILMNVNNKYDYENGLIDRLSDLIDQGRKTDNQNKRARIYSNALDVVMELAIELPTYQRSDLFAYNEIKIDTTTFTAESELSPYKGLTSDIHKVSLYIK